MLLNEIVPRLGELEAQVHFLSDDGEAKSFTFRALHEEVRHLAVRLRQLGVVPGTRVGILAPSSYRWLVWDLAILDCGAVSVAFAHEPVNVPIGSVMDRLAIGLIAASSDLLPRNDFASPEVVDINDRELTGKEAALRFPRGVADERTHSLAFSSGTTGKVKGLLISRPGTEHLLNLYEAAFGVEPNDRFMTFLPFANYQQRMAYYFCLYHGVDFVYVPYQRMFQGLKQFCPTYMVAPPVFYDVARTMAEVGAGAYANEEERRAFVTQRLKALLGGNVRYLITGMAPIKRSTLDFFWSHEVSLYEAFGITEAGMVCWNKPGQVRIGSVGRPAETGSVTFAEDGEVLITRDALLSLGYFDSSEEDACLTFVGPNTVATGDIAHMDSDGFVVIDGRKKDAIVTKSGEKFHPEVIENRLLCHPGVKSAVVLGGEPLSANTALLVVGNREDTTLTDDIRMFVDQLNPSLPQHQRIRHVLFIENDFTIENGMRTHNLKLNRRAILARHQTALLEMEGA